MKTLFKTIHNCNWWFVAVIGFLPLSLHAQEVFPSDTVLQKNEKDIKDVVHTLFKTHPPDSSKRKKNLQYAFFPALGYTSNTGFALAAGANAIFTLNGSQKESNILSSITYTQFNQVILPFQVSVWSKKDQFNFILDSRYINYPSSAYGLRGRSKLDSGYAINFSWIKVHPSVLARIANNFYGGAGIFYDYLWRINETGVPVVLPTAYNPLGIATAFEHYVKKKIPPAHETALGPAVKLLFDSRDNPVNALKGIFASVLFHQSFKSWGSDTNWSSLVVDVRKYISFSSGRESVLAFWAYYWQNFGKSSFLLLPSTGWDDSWNTGRGYSQGRYRGNIMRYLEAEYRFQIMNNGLIGGVIFSNLQNFPNEFYTSYSQHRGRKEIPVTSLGYGFGLRVKFNKYSKTNMAIDLGFGQSFPKPWIAVNLGEVF
ncbi:MAG: hypothetical protein B6D37_11080 [Sphingobacteriales bacterium UTBCD1]|jgi:hypothetical protein|nr:MAG: hypothetical protein B6D37_11080 [Sphingobacteriales bacterium UTBCD1]